MARAEWTGKRGEQWSDQVALQFARGTLTFTQNERGGFGQKLKV
jgi:hypothetical protein